VKGKTVITVLATGMFLFALWSSALGFSYGRDGFFYSKKTLINEKAGVASAMDSPLLSPNHSELAGEYRNQPMLVGMMMIFIAVSACGVGFVCHLLRSDDPL
jgi:hypothetical protein